MNRTLYSLLVYLALPVIFCRLLWRSRSTPAYRQRLVERFAVRFPVLKTNGIWIHAVSVGESIAVAPLVRALQARYPDCPITITGMTPTGSERIQALFGSSVQHCYLPYDTPWAAKRFLKRVQPRLAIMMETELWPNYINQCHHQGIPCTLVNARLSARSARGYARFSALTRPMFAQLDWVAVQTETEARRFRFLGVSPKHITVTGSVKFDQRIDPAIPPEAKELRTAWHAEDRPIWIAASTHEGEDLPLLQIQRRLLAKLPDALLILVPRHPERFASVSQLCLAEGFNLIQRSSKQPVTPKHQVLLVDSMGELPLFYALADVAFVGGSLIPHGGHNLLEPAALKLPILTGPHLFNFLEIARQLHQAGALDQVANAKALYEKLLRLLQNPERRQQMGQAGLNVLRNNQGALSRVLIGLKRWLEPRAQSSAKLEAQEA
ncbi:3-deoxy-D-manno-octulosonic-acid transferase [Azomonas agilis]|uniref:3-deoxy-D-manno-octulosonic acid transferase n=1 Tax=Azomonas agilis TaxID=116849 RepID=A0A562IZV2_9GAMM|nr:lipid IV(A) 3-deoxy-D-manno-octulosonic acid transferase [Azomonas agilis]TWH76094.1 3-deoxy-D-manno-octulosonic-acid transferase [Azomonas agilis]